jgi:hypothetical protein
VVGQKKGRVFTEDATKPTGPTGTRKVSGTLPGGRKYGGTLTIEAKGQAGMTVSAPLALTWRHEKEVNRGIGLAFREHIAAASGHPDGLAIYYFDKERTEMLMGYSLLPGAVRAVLEQLAPTE